MKERILKEKALALCKKMLEDWLKAYQFDVHNWQRPVNRGFCDWLILERDEEASGYVLFELGKDRKEGLGVAPYWYPYTALSGKKIDLLYRINHLRRTIKRLENELQNLHDS